LSGFTGGDQYTVSFYADGRNGNGPGAFQALVDGTPLSFGVLGTTITPAVTGYVLYTSDPFTAGSATPTLEFNATNGTSDLSSYVDLVTVAAVVPEPSSLVLLMIGIAGLSLIIRRRKT
jgi:hypothetical protein